VVAIVLTSLAALLAMNTLRERLSTQPADQADLAVAKYHFVMIAGQLDSSFWLEAYQGARDAAAEVQAVVELVGTEQYSADRSPELVEIAITARLDGIATFVADPRTTRTAIDGAVAAGIPVVTLEYDASGSARQCFVGVNSYDLGQSFGKLLAAQERDGLAVILVGDDPAASNLPEGQIVAGLRDYLAENPITNLQTLEIDRTSAFSAETALRQLLLDNQAKISTIISLNVDDTLRLVESLVDYDRSGSIRVLCYQENPDVLDYVESGLIEAVLASDPYQIGYDSILALAELKQYNRTNEYVPARLVTINRSNVEDYLATGLRNSDPVDSLATGEALQ
jgi:ribose transport system substrate-binding protein